jgi:fluoroacetyl-CoA thioesterase
MALQPGAVEEFGYEVQPHHLASNLEGSEGGALFPEVYSTGAMVGLMEATCARQLAPTLSADEISAGAGLERVEHTAATTLGAKVHARTTYRGLEGKFHIWDVQAFDAVGPIGSCVHRRVVLERARFHEKARARAKAGGA